MKVMLLAGLVFGSSCFVHTPRRDPYTYRYESRPDRYYRYDRSDRWERGNARAVRRLPRHARIERRGGETYARVRGQWFVWDPYLRGWVMLR